MRLTKALVFLPAREHQRGNAFYKSEEKTMISVAKKPSKWGNYKT